MNRDNLREAFDRIYEALAETFERRMSPELEADFDLLSEHLWPTLRAVSPTAHPAEQDTPHPSLPAPMDAQWHFDKVGPTLADGSPIPGRPLEDEKASQRP